MSIFLLSEALANDERILVDSLENRLYHNGFDNTAIIDEDTCIIITYENRLYRNEIRAIREILDILLPIVKEKRSIVLIPQTKSIPIISIHIPGDKYLAFIHEQVSDEEFTSSIEVSLTVDSIWRKIKSIKKAEIQTYRLDLVLHPQIKLQFGDFNDPIQSQLNLIPEVNIFLWRGMLFSTQMIIPLQNEFGAEGDALRPGKITFNQTIRFPYECFFSTTIGNFTRNRYGVEMNFRKYFFNGKFYIGADLGYTGFATYLDNTWYYQNMNYMTALYHMGYRIEKYDVLIRAMYGKFLYQDQGGRLDVARQFNSISIGFYGIMTQHGHDVGFNFSIPLFPARFLQTKAFRIRPAREFSWEYRYHGLETIGYQYDSGNSIDQFMNLLNPDFIKNQMSNLMRRN